MKLMRLGSLPLFLTGLSALVGAGCPHSGGSVARPPSASGSTHAEREFSERVKKYVKLRKRIESSLPSLKMTKDSSNITDHQNALARKIYDARRDAKQGDIFTPDVTAEFRERLSSEFHGPDSSQARTTIKQGEPLKAVSLEVNNTFPEGVPSTTVPPTLLQKLPPLPPGVEYRIVDRYLVLADVTANLVVDFIDGSIPGKSVK